MATVIYMVRRAESPFKFGEERTRRLSKEGKIATRKVTELLTDKDIDVIASSSYTRAVQTVQDLAFHDFMKCNKSAPLCLCAVNLGYSV
ncbi:histidine phosphatase family protein [Bacillus sp. XF8]|nr:histidine phosphatase family protein [Bacillus sp. XF8]